MTRVPAAATTIIALLIAGTFGANPARAEVGAASAGAIGWIGGEGGFVLINGAIVCPVDESFAVRVTMAQDQTGAQGRGVAAGVCNGDVQAWSVVAVGLEGYPAFQPGNARLCWNTQSGGAGEEQDGLFQRCEPMLLSVPESTAT